MSWQSRHESLDDGRFTLECAFLLALAALQMAPSDVGPVHSLAWDSKHRYLAVGGNAVMLLFKVRAAAAGGVQGEEKGQQAGRVWQGHWRPEERHEGAAAAGHTKPWALLAWRVSGTGSRGGGGQVHSVQGVRGTAVEQVNVEGAALKGDVGV